MVEKSNLKAPPYQERLADYFAVIGLGKDP